MTVLDEVQRKRGHCPARNTASTHAELRRTPQQIHAIVSARTQAAQEKGGQLMWPLTKLLTRRPCPTFSWSLLLAIEGRTSLGHAAEIYDLAVAAR
jgi:hypothetical protein